MLKNSSSAGLSWIGGILILAAFSLVVGGGLYLYNPIERGKESRDQKRVDELSQLSKALKLYLLNNSGKPSLCDGCSLGKDFFAHSPLSIDGNSAKVVGLTVANSTGWVPVDLSLNADIGKTPLYSLPIDPLDKAPYVFTFTPGLSGSFKLTAAFESKAFQKKAADDSGTLTDRYEVGTDLKLVPD